MLSAVGVTEGKLTSNNYGGFWQPASHWELRKAHEIFVDLNVSCKQMHNERLRERRPVVKQADHGLLLDTNDYGLFDGGCCGQA